MPELKARKTSGRCVLMQQWKSTSDSRLHLSVYAGHIVDYFQSVSSRCRNAAITGFLLDRLFITDYTLSKTLQCSLFYWAGWRLTNGYVNYEWGDIAVQLDYGRVKLRCTRCEYTRGVKPAAITHTKERVNSGYGDHSRINYSLHAHSLQPSVLTSVTYTTKKDCSRFPRRHK
jgi:hypothetical protein